MGEATDQVDRRVVDDRRAREANAGDRGAAGEYLAENLPYLLSIARRISNGVLDPDDLAADAIAALLALWAEGRGPTSNPNAYLSRAMRNRLIDEYRSPRSRVGGILDADEELQPHFDSTRRTDLHREYAYVAAALQSLPPDQQLVLKAVVVDGRKPGDLEGELARRAPAISSLLRRAKLSLRRATLRVVLEEDAPADCRRAAGDLPESVAVQMEDVPRSRGMAHIRTCDRCRAAWGRFGALTSALGTVALLVAGSVLSPSGSAEADDRPRGTPTATPSVVRRLSGARRISLVPQIMAIASVVVGVLLIALALPAVQNLLSGGPIGGLQLAVTSRALPAERAEIDVDLRLGDTEDVVVELLLPPGLSVLSTPEAWDCSPSSTGAICRGDATSRVTFALVDSRPDEAGGYRLLLAGHRGDRAVSGVAEGQVRSETQTVTATVG